VESWNGVESTVGIAGSGAIMVLVGGRSGERAGKGGEASGRVCGKLSYAALNESKPSGGLKRPTRRERGVDFEVGDIEPSASFAVAIFDVLRATVRSKRLLFNAKLAKRN
jgi:hypothetical protein